MPVPFFMQGTVPIFAAPTMLRRENGDWLRTVKRKPRERTLAVRCLSPFSCRGTGTVPFCGKWGLAPNGQAKTPRKTLAVRCLSPFSTSLRALRGKRGLAPNGQAKTPRKNTGREVPVPFFMPGTVPFCPRGPVPFLPRLFNSLVGFAFVHATPGVECRLPSGSARIWAGHSMRAVIEG